MASLPINTSFDYRKVGRQAGQFLIKNRVIASSLVLLVVGVLALNRITSLTKPEIDSSHLAKQLETLQEVTFDEEAIERISSLRESNIEIESQFTTRNNPFDE